MGIELNITSYQKRILLDLENENREPDTDETPTENGGETVNMPTRKPITASIADVLALQNAIMVSTTKTIPVPNGTYNLPNGQAIVHNNENGTTGVQFVGTGGCTLNELKKLIQKGLLPIKEEESSTQGINGEIDEPVSQGGTGDCWILTGILSLTATAEGKALIKAAMEVQANGDVIVHFKGLGYSIRVTAAEIKKYDTDNIKNDAFSNGDNDMLVFELAVQKLFEEHPDLKTAYGYTEDYSGADRYITQGGFGNDLVEWLSGNTAQDTSALDVLDDPYEKADVEEWVTIPSTIPKFAGKEFPRPGSISYDEMFNATKTDFSNAYINWYNNTYVPLVREYNQTAPQLLVDGLSEEEIMAQLQEAYENQPCAITFGLYVFANDTKKTAQCVDGTTFSWSYYSNNVKDGVLCGHAFAVVGMTRDTITFVNPWDSTQEITMTWSEFAKLGIGRISYNELDSIEPDNNDPVINEPDTDDSDVDGPDDEPVVDNSDTESGFNSYSEIVDYLNSDELKNYIKQVLGDSFNEESYNKAINLCKIRYKIVLDFKAIKFGEKPDVSLINKSQIQQSVLDAMDSHMVDNPNGISSTVELKMFISYEDLKNFLRSNECATAVFGKNWLNSIQNVQCLKRLSKFILAEHENDFARVSTQDIIEEMRAALKDKSNAVVHGTTLDDLKNTYGLRDSEIKAYFDCDTRTGQYYLKPDIFGYKSMMSGRNHISSITNLLYLIKEIRNIQSHQYDPSSWALWEHSDDNNFIYAIAFKGKALENHIPSIIIQTYFNQDSNGNYMLKDGFENFKLLNYNQDTKTATYSIDITKTDGEVVTLEFTVDTTTNELKGQRYIQRH